MIFGDLSAYVFIDGQELSEYNVIVSSTPTENRITCWIASEEGKVCCSSYVLAKALCASIRNLESDGPTQSNSPGASEQVSPLTVFVALHKLRAQAGSVQRNART